MDPRTSAVKKFHAPEVSPALKYWIVLVLPLLLMGCAPAGPPLGHWFGPTTQAVVVEKSIQLTDGTAKVLQTTHYNIYTTIDDPVILGRIAQIMEGSFGAYEMLAEGVTPTKSPMDCYIFAKRSQWAEFTRQHTGSQAQAYLQINRGGYTRGDWYVSYYIGESSTLSVAAHEGWHQFSFRNFRANLPPFLEEGLATMFEGVKLKNGVPRYNLSINQNRAIALGYAINSNTTWNLEEVMGMHAGMILDRPGDKINSFYAQAWALARFLWDGDNGAHRAALRQMILDAADGVIYDPNGLHRNKLRGWNSAGVKGMLENYLQMDFADINTAYLQFMHHIVNDELPSESDEPM